MCTLGLLPPVNVVNGEVAAVYDDLLVDEPTIPRVQKNTAPE
jgi:hypothetical protein